MRHSSKLEIIPEHPTNDYKRCELWLTEVNLGTEQYPSLNSLAE